MELRSGPCGLMWLARMIGSSPVPRKKKDPRLLLPKPGYSFADVLVLTSATRSNLIHWTNIGAIKAAIEDTAGPGYPRRFSALNVIEVELAASLNRFRVPVETITGALNVFRAFHRGAVAVHAEATNAPLVPDRPGGALFGSLEQRRRAAEAFIRNEAFRIDSPLPQAMEVAAVRAKEMGEIWGEFRRGSWIRGVPDPTFQDRFLGLFVGEAFAAVELDPKNLRLVIEGSAIVIDLLAVVFSVGQRCGLNGVVLDAF